MDTSIDPTVQAYLTSNTIPQATRANVASMLDSGKISEQDAVGIINQKYPGQFSSPNVKNGGTTQPAPATQLPQTADQAGGAIAKGLVNALNPANLPSDMEAVGKGMAAVGNAATQSGLTVQPQTQDVAAMQAAGQAANKAGITPPSMITDQTTGQQRQPTPDEVNAGVQKVQQQMNPIGTAAAQAGGQAVQGAEQIAGGVGQAFQGQAEQGSQQAAQGFQKMIGGAEGVINSPITGTIESLPDEIKNPIKQGTDAGMTFVANALGKYLGVDTSKDNVMQPLKLAIQTALMGGSAADLAGKLEGAGTEAATGEAAAEETPETAPAGHALVKQLATKFGGLSPDTVDTILNHPEEWAAAQGTPAEVARQGAMETFKDYVDNVRSTLSENGPQYQAIRSAAAPIDVPDGWLDNKLGEYGLNVDDAGKISATSASDIRNPSDIAAIQKFYDVHGDTLNGNAPLDSNTFLNARQDLGDISRFDATGKTPASSGFAKDVYGDMNSEFRDQIDGLDKVDASNSAAMKTLKQVQGVIQDAKGNLKDSAVNNVSNLLNDAKAGTLARLQKAMPDFDWDEFKTQLNISKALTQVEKAGGNIPGMYTNNLSMLTGVGTGLISGGAIGAGIGGAIAAVLSNPRVMSALLTKYGQAIGDTSMAANVLSTISKGAALTAQGSAFLTTALNSEKQLE